MESCRSAFPDLGGILEHGTNLFLIHSIHCCLIDSESDEALTMICLTATPCSSALSRTGQMRLHELSLRAHIGMEFGQENPRRERVIGSLGLPVNLNCREKVSLIGG